MNAINPLFPFHHADEFDNEKILDLLERNGDELCAVLEMAACSPAVDSVAVIAAALQRPDEAAAEIFYSLADLRMTLEGLIAERDFRVATEGSGPGGNFSVQAASTP